MSAALPRLFAIAAVLLPVMAAAQEPSTASLDATRLGVSLDRIQRELAQAEARESRSADGLNLFYRVEVFGKAPPIDVIGEFNLATGPTIGTAPSHQEVVDYLTPQMFRSPVPSFGNVVSWATQKLGERSRRQRCEEELEAYRAQVQAGVNVAAPTCAR